MLANDSREALGKPQPNSNRSCHPIELSSAGVSTTVCLETPVQTLKRRKADIQVKTDSRPFIQEEVWTAYDFPTELDKDLAITHAHF
ncbi:hypothetical protein WJX77_009697 [Trebouxia sp. C0004]